MTNLLTVLPDLDLQPYSHILPSLEKALISTADLLTLDALDVAKRANVPPGEVKKLADAVLERLQNDLRSGVRSGVSDGTGQESARLNSGHASISTLDDGLDDALNGGINYGCLTEIVGESAVGKTQLLLSLLLSVQLPSSSGQQRGALYISTEAPLQTTRLNQILQSHPKLSSLPASDKPNLSRIQSTHIHDLEAQEHILRFQVPVALRNQNIGLLVIDSIAANFRAEFDKAGGGGSAQQRRGGIDSFAKRSAQVAQLGTLLRQLAQTHNVAVVVANQVADRFSTIEPPVSQSVLSSQISAQSSPAVLQPPKSSSALALDQAVPGGDIGNRQIQLSTDDPLALDHQQRFFTGWGDDPAVSNLKTPSLGLTWTNQLTARIALLKEPIYAERAYEAGEEREIAGWRREMKVVFSGWCAESSTPFEIWEGGVKSIEE